MRERDFGRRSSSNNRCKDKFSIVSRLEVNFFGSGRFSGAIVNNVPKSMAVSTLKKRTFEETMAILATIFAEFLSIVILRRMKI